MGEIVQLPGTTKKPRIILFDIESTNLAANFGFVLCVGYKELGGKTKVLSIRDYKRHKVDCTDDRPLLRDVYNVLAGADMVVTYFGKGFDWKYLNTRLLLLPGRPVLPPVPHVDLYFTAKHHLKLHSNRLASVSEFLGTQSSKTPLKQQTWVRAMSGHLDSIRYVETHCEADVDVLEECYNILRPFVRQHPNLGIFDVTGHAACRVCKGTDLQRRGLRVSRNTLKQQVQCNSCKAWGLLETGKLLVSAG